ncbi:MAG: hypothetical protein ACXVH2_08450 [Methanobacterium sp.]
MDRNILLILVGVLFLYGAVFYNPRSGIVYFGGIIASSFIIVLGMVRFYSNYKGSSDSKLP